MNRRSFLAGLFATPAIVKIDALMPIRVWRPTLRLTRNVGMGPFLTCRVDDLAGVDLGMGWGGFASAPGQCFIGLHQRSAALELPPPIVELWPLTRQRCGRSAGCLIWRRRVTGCRRKRRCACSSAGKRRKLAGLLERIEPGLQAIDPAGPLPNRQTKICRSARGSPQLFGASAASRSACADATPGT